MPATLRNDLYERLVDRLRHAAQYAGAARGTAEAARSGYRAEREEVVAMTAEATERLAHQLLRAEQYAEAAQRAVQDALGLLEQATRAEESDA